MFKGYNAIKRFRAIEAGVFNRGRDTVLHLECVVGNSRHLKLRGSP